MVTVKKLDGAIAHSFFCGLSTNQLEFLFADSKPSVPHAPRHRPHFDLTEILLKSAEHCGLQ